MEDFLYAQVAGRLESLIRKGLLKTGDKLASVRALSKEQGISMSTAYKAYCELEQRGFIEARTKSGYYVRYSRRAIPDTPEPVDKAPGAALGVTPGAIPGAIPGAASGTAKKTADMAPGAPSGASWQNTSDLVDRVLPRFATDATVVRFSMAAPSLELLPRARLSKMMAEALRRDPTGCLGYDQLQGNALLRQQIALQAFRWNGSVKPDDIVTTHGCTEAVTLCLMAVTQPGDTVVLETPTFYGLIRSVRNLGLNVLEIPGNPQTGIDIDYLEKALAKAKEGESRISAGIFIPNFSNPLGACMPDKNKIRLVQLLEKENIPLIEDDIYGDLHFDQARPRTCKSWDKTGNVLLCSSMSKSLAPGYRVGWCIPGKYLDKVLALKRIHGVASTYPTHAAIGLFLANNRFDLHMRHLRKALHTQSLQYIQAIAKYFPKDTRVTQPRGGYVLWVEMNRAVHAFTLFQSAIEEKISISPGPLFSMDERYGHCMRLSFGQTFTPEVDRALRTLGRLVHQAQSIEKK